MVAMLEWLNKWQTTTHQEYKKNNFEILDNYLNISPINILDIGCGLAYESESFQRKYNSNLYLLDGDFSKTIENKRDVGYGPSKNFKFYNTIKSLHESFDKRNLRYKFLDACNLKLDENVKFDLIYSILSCGFHYPVYDYITFIKKHSDDNSRIILDIRKNILHEQIQYVDVIKVVHNYRQYQTVEIKIK